MLCTESITLETPSVLAIVAILISLLSAIYARTVSSEARRSNEIALLGHRKAILDAFVDLKMHMEQRAQGAELEQVTKFYLWSRNSKIYFMGDLSEKILKYYGDCFKVADLYTKGNKGFSIERDEINAAFQSAKSAAQDIEDEMVRVIKTSGALG